MYRVWITRPPASAPRPGLNLIRTRPAGRHSKMKTFEPGGLPAGDMTPAILSPTKSYGKQSGSAWPQKNNCSKTRVDGQSLFHGAPSCRYGRTFHHFPEDDATLV